MFDKLKETKELDATITDNAGTSTVPSDIYTAVVDSNYVGKSKGGAMYLHLVLKLENGFTHTEDIYFTSGDAKGNTNTYTKNGKTFYLPGFITVTSLCKLTVGKSLTKMKPENKVVKVYDFDQKKEVPEEKPVLMDIIGKEVRVAIIEKKVNKQTKNNDGAYINTSESRIYNEIVKFLSKDNLTVSEINTKSEGKFAENWLKNNKGKLKDLYKPVKESNPFDPNLDEEDDDDLPF